MALPRHTARSLPQRVYRRKLFATEWVRESERGREVIEHVRYCSKFRHDIIKGFTLQSCVIAITRGPLIGAAPVRNPPGTLSPLSKLSCRNVRSLACCRTRELIHWNMKQVRFIKGYLLNWKMNKLVLHVACIGCVILLLRQLVYKSLQGSCSKSLLFYFHVFTSASSSCLKPLF
jgi:hypothetical protein